MMAAINETALLKRCNEWWQAGGASMSWACRMLHISKETFRSQYAGTKVRVIIDGSAQNAKYHVHPYDVLMLLDI